MLVLLAILVILVIVVIVVICAHQLFDISVAVWLQRN